MPMTKTQVVAYLAEKVGVTKKQAGAVLVELADLAAKIIKKGDKLALPGICNGESAASQSPHRPEPADRGTAQDPGQKGRKSGCRRGLERNSGSQEKIESEIPEKGAILRIALFFLLRRLRKKAPMQGPSNLRRNASSP